MFKDSRAFSSFAVDDLEAARPFYGATLGLDLHDSRQSGFLEIHLPGGRGVLVYPKPDHVPATFTVLDFGCSDVAAAVDALTAAGVRMKRHPELEADEKGISRSMGPAIAWFRDPAGNILSVVEDDGA